MTNEGAKPGRLAAWAGIVLLIVYLVFIGGGFPGIYAVQLRIVSLLLITLGLGIWAVVAVRHPRWRPSTRLWIAFAVALGSFALSTIASTNPRMSLEYLGYAVMLTALYLLLQRLYADPFFRVRLGSLTVLLCLSLAALYIATVFSEWLRWWSLVGRVVAPPLRPWFEGLLFGNPSAVMTVCVLLLAPALAHVGYATPRARALSALLVLLVLIVTVMSGSRAGWLGLAIGLAVTLAAWLASPGRRALVHQLVGPGQVRVGIAALLVAGGVATILVGPSAVRRLVDSGDGGRGSYYAATLRMIPEHPLLGSGPGTWPILRAAHTDTADTDYYIPHAHDIYLETTSEFGVAGVAAGVIALGFLLWLIRDALLDADSVRRRYAWAALFATAYFGGHQLLDFYPNMPAALFAFAIPIAWLDATAVRSPLRALPSSLPRAAQVAFGLAVVGALAFHGWSESNALTNSSAVDAANRGDWTSAAALAQQAVTADPDVPVYHFTLGLAAARTGDLTLAAQSFRTVATTDDLPEAWLDLAAIEAEQGNSDGARDSLARALRIGHQQTLVLVGAVEVYRRLGDLQTMRATLVEAIESQPTLAGDPWLTSNSQLAAIRTEAIRGAIDGVPPDSGWQIALFGGDPAAASSLAGQLGSDPRAFATDVIRAWGGDQASLDSLRARSLGNPLDAGDAWWVALVESHVGDTRETDRFRSWAAAINGPAGVPSGETRVVSGLKDGEASSGSLTGFYGYYTYRRPTPLDQLVPGLPRLVVR